MLRKTCRRQKRDAILCRSVEALEPRRLLSAGDLDASFGAGGKVLTDLPGGLSATGLSAVLQTDGKLVVAGRVARAGDPEGDFLVARYAAGNSGQLDPGFGGGAGFVTIDFGRGNDGANAVALGPGGKIVVVGSTEAVAEASVPQPPGPADFAMARLNPDGSLDTTFDTDGRQTVDFNPAVSARAIARDVAVRNDGSMVVAGESGSNAAFAALRPNGTLDPAFDTDGMAVHFFGNAAMIRAYAIAFDSAGRILAAGQRATQIGSDTRAPVARLLPSGAPDTSFGTGGTGALIVEIGAPVFTDVQTAPGGKVIATGGSFRAARLNSDGTLDLPYGGGDGVASATVGTSSIATSGIVLADGSAVLGGFTGATAGAAPVPAVVKFTPDGNTSFIANDGVGTVEELIAGPGTSLVTVGSTPDGASDTAHVVVSRRLANGPLDPTFASGGQAVTDLVGPSSQAVADLVALPGGGTLVLGIHATGSGRGHDFVLARYTPAGVLDTTFADGHTIAYLDHQNRTDVPTALLLQPDGKILAAGRSGNDVLVARYQPNGVLDSTFGDGGRLAISDVEGFPVTPVPPAGPPGAARPAATAVQPVSLAIQPDGRIVVAATVGALFSDQRLALLRLTGEGDPDPAFGGGDGSVVVTNRASGMPMAVALAGGNKIVVAGTRAPALNTSGTIYVARFTPAGTLDATFGNETGFAPTSPSGYATAVAAGHDGAITVGAWSSAGNTAGNTDFVALRFTSDGQPDRTFSGDGLATADFGARNDQLRDLVLLPDGSVLAAGVSPAGFGIDPRPNGDFAFAKFTPAGQPDAAFGAGDGTADGRITFDFAGMGDAANAVALDAQGRIIAAGGAYVPARSTDFALVRLEGSGPAGPEALSMSMGSSAWTTPFRAAVATTGYGDGQGYMVQRGQFGWSHLGWVNVDDITVRFAAPADGIGRESLRVRGTNAADYPVAAFNYEPATRTATWRLAQPVSNDRIVVELNTDADPAFESQWRPSVLGGDATGDGIVNATDLSELRRRLNRSLANPGAGNVAYTVFVDITGDGRINALDMAGAKQRLNRRLPTASPAGPVSVAEELFARTPVLPG